MILQTLQSSWKLKLYMLQRLPTLLFWGVRIRHIDQDTCTIEMHHGWRNQNPFRSIYFAAQMGAAEFSTGTLALVALGETHNVSMLVTSVNSQYFKKATGLCTFTCDEGARIREVIQKTLQSTDSQSLTLSVKGLNEQGEHLTTVDVTWSFKRRK